MKEIKFRAWDKDRKVMANVSNIDFLTGQVQMNAGGMHSERVSGDKVILLQYTGLKDKSGVQIYEGDILKTFSNINKYTDSFAEDIEPKFEYTTVVRDGACFKTTYKKRPSYVLNENGGSMVEHMEVIGNIWEDGDLLDSE